MAILFSIDHKKGYFISKYIGKVTSDEIIELYNLFFKGNEWTPGLNELVDNSDLDGSELSGKHLRNVASFAESFYKTHDISSVKTAIYAPSDLPFGLSRVYDVMTDNSPEHVAVFRDLKEAKRWLGD